MSSEGRDASSAVSPAPGRPSAVAPEVRLERRVSPWFGFFFYGFLFAAAWVWLASTGQAVKALWIPKNLPLELGVGAGAGLLMVAITPLLVGRVAALRNLEREFGWILGEQRAWECVYLALASAVAEELFFRGAVPAAMGPVLATALFAGLHWPLNAQFRAWPVTALLAGAVLMAERHYTGTLVAPVLTHAIVNAVNLVRITRNYRVWKE